MKEANRLKEEQLRRQKEKEKATVKPTTVALSPSKIDNVIERLSKPIETSHHSVPDNAEPVKSVVLPEKAIDQVFSRLAQKKTLSFILKKEPDAVQPEPVEAVVPSKVVSADEADRIFSRLNIKRTASNNSMVKHEPMTDSKKAPAPEHVSQRVPSASSNNSPVTKSATTSTATSRPHTDASRATQAVDVAKSESAQPVKVVPGKFNGINSPSAAGFTIKASMVIKGGKTASTPTDEAGKGKVAKTPSSIPSPKESSPHVPPNPPPTAKTTTKMPVTASKQESPAHDDYFSRLEATLNQLNILTGMDPDLSDSSDQENPAPPSVSTPVVTSTGKVVRPGASASKQ